MEQTLRQKAIAWWNSKTDRDKLMDDYFIDREESSLTGREIQSIYEAEHPINSEAKNYVGVRFKYSHFDQIFRINKQDNVCVFIVYDNTNTEPNIDMFSINEVEENIEDGTWVIVPESEVLPVHKCIEVDDKSNIIYYSTPKVTNDTITFYGAGIFRETGLCLNKKQAMMAYIDLHKFIMKDENGDISPIKVDEYGYMLFADKLPIDGQRIHYWHNGDKIGTYDAKNNIVTECGRLPKCWKPYTPESNDILLLEEAAINRADTFCDEKENRMLNMSEKEVWKEIKNSFIHGAEWQKANTPKSYSEAEVLKILDTFNRSTLKLQEYKLGNSYDVKDWWEDFKQQTK